MRVGPGPLPEYRGYRRAHEGAQSANLDGSNKKGAAAPALTAHAASLHMAEYAREAHELVESCVIRALSAG